MKYTSQIKRAIQFAARKHNNQFRIERGLLPYITHPFSVALIVAENLPSDKGEDVDTDIVSAAILHDVIEDTDTTREEIIENFNECVADLVEDVSETKMKDGERINWKERKTKYISHLEEAPEEALIVAMADKIDNIESKIEVFEREGETFLKNWKNPVSEYLWFHSEVLRISKKRLPVHPLTKRLSETHAREQKIFSAL